MKKIKFQSMGSAKRYNPQTDSVDTVEAFADVEMDYNETNLAIAQERAHNGEYTIEDDGVEETAVPSQLDIIEAQVTYTAMMTDTLLEV